MSALSEFRLVWKREGNKPKRRVFKTSAGAARFMKLFGPEPWLAYGKRRGRALGPDDYYCCAGHECGCDGDTLREHSDAVRATMPALEYLRLETRTVGAWEAQP